MKAILALDAGTANVKAILVDDQTNVLARSSVPLSIWRSPTAELSGLGAAFAAARAHGRSAP
jgi:glycerol kinase